MKRCPTRRSGASVCHPRLATGPLDHYAAQGELDGEPMLFLHGDTDSWFSFSRLLPLLPTGYRAFAFDQRGHGDSRAPRPLLRHRGPACRRRGVTDIVGVEQAKSVFAAEPTDAPCQRQTSDSRLGDDAHRYGQPERLRLVVKITNGDAAFCPDRLGERDRLEHPSSGIGQSRARRQHTAFPAALWPPPRPGNEPIVLPGERSPM